jgi:ATP-dependent Lon protease
VGGIKEKVLAAHRAGVKTVILPRENERDLEDVPEELRHELEFVLADAAEDVLARALGIEVAGSPAPGTRGSALVGAGSLSVASGETLRDDRAARRTFRRPVRRTR